MSSEPDSDREDLRLALAVAAVAAAPFLATAPFCGLYLDDYSFFRMLADASPAGLWLEFLHYVPGRNLHIPLFWGLLRLCGGSVAAMHLVGVGFDALNAALLFLVVLRLTRLRSVALAVAAAFAVVPSHGETHFWITLIPQCQIPLTLVLWSFLLFLSPGRLLAGCAIYALALFTYDQVFFLWPLLLITARLRDPAPNGGRYAAASAGLLVLNGAHLAARYLSPYASGGRPLIRLRDFFDRVLDAAVAVRKGALPWPTSSHAHWLWSVPIILCSIAVAAGLLHAVRGRAGRESALLRDWTGGRGWLHAALGGLAWTALAYGPNLFWFLSPRHNLIPSAGWCLSLAALGARLATLGPRASRAVSFMAALFFAAAAVSDVHEGTQWIDSRHLQDGYLSAARRLSPPVDSLFLLGAPRSLRRAPAFNLRHDVVFSAGLALDRPRLETGDNTASPTRRGLLYSNDLSLLPAEAVRWIPASAANVISYDPARRAFACVSALRVTLPDGSSTSLPLRPNPNCAPVFPMTADVVLLSSRQGPPPLRPAKRARAGGLTPLSASVAVRGATTSLELVWRIDSTPEKTLGFIPRIRDAEGRVTLDAVFASRPGNAGRPMIWPLVDDLAPTMGLKPGRTLSETFLLNRAPASPLLGSVLELDVFEFEADGRAASLGSLSLPLGLRP